MRSGRWHQGIDLLVEITWFGILCELVSEFLVRGLRVVEPGFRIFLRGLAIMAACSAERRVQLDRREVLREHIIARIFNRFLGNVDPRRRELMQPLLIDRILVFRFGVGHDIVDAMKLQSAFFCSVANWSSDIFR